MRKPLFQISDRLAERLEALRPSRRYRACKDVLRRIGQFCVDELLDGEVTEVDLRGLDDTSRWRVFRGYVDLLLRCGALELNPWGTYSIPFYLDRNLPADLRAKKNAELREKDRLAAAAYRRRQPLVGSTSTSAMISDTLPLRHTEPTPDQGEERENPTNEKQAGSEICANIVPFSVVSENTEAYDFEAAARRIMGMSTKGENVDTSAPEVDVIDMSAAKVIAFKPARMPKDAIAANLGTAIGALRELGVDDCDEGERLFAELWRIRAREVEVGYAVWIVSRQRRKGRRITSPRAYILKVIANQRSYRGEMAIAA